MSVFCLTISRFNHSCDANANNFFNIENNKSYVHACRKIIKGEEILISYYDTLNLPKEDRL